MVLCWKLGLPEKLWIRIYRNIRSINSTISTCKAFLSASLKTATVFTPRRLAVLMILQAISPLFAMRSLSILRTAWLFHLRVPRKVVLRNWMNKKKWRIIIHVTMVSGRFFCIFENSRTNNYMQLLKSLITRKVRHWEG